MAGTYSIDIQLLHYQDIVKHICFRDNITFPGIEFMAVRPLDKHRLPVYKKLISNYLHITETNLQISPFSYARFV